MLTEDPAWFDWSAGALEECASSSQLCLNAMIYAEVSAGFERIEELDAAPPISDFTRLALPCEAAFLAGKACVRYRRAKGTRRSPLPDFFIGAHAAIAQMPLLTRDAQRYRTYFPTVRLIAPA